MTQCQSATPDGLRPDVQCPDQMCGFMGQCRHKPVHGAQFGAPVEKAAPSTPSDARALAQMLMAGADDPMWANHAEVNKATLRRAAEALRFMAGQVECLAACVDPAAFEEVKPSKAARVHAIVNTGPYPGMSEAFNAHMGAECWTDPAYAPDASTWAAAWRAALSAQQAAQPVAGEPPAAAPVAPQAAQPPRGWLLRWPKPGGGHSWLWQDGPKEPDFVPFPRVPLYEAAAPVAQPLTLDDDLVHERAREVDKAIGEAIAGHFNKQAIGALMQTREMLRERALKDKP